MSAADDTRVRFDFGRMVMAPLSLLFVLISISNAYRTYIAPAPLSVLKALTVSNGLLATGFYVLMIVAYLLRGQARATSTSAPARIVAIGATFLPFSLVLFRHHQQSDLRLLALGSAILMAGLLISLWSLYTLGRNLSIIPQARQLVDSGPYRYVRHPLYVGEILSVIGLVISRYPLLAIVVPIVLASLQSYRATQEERLLASAFGDYRTYMSRTRRFLPGMK